MVDVRGRVHSPGCRGLDWSIQDAAGCSIGDGLGDAQLSLMLTKDDLMPLENEKGKEL